MKYKSLRKKYPKFIYENYSYKISGNNLEIFFDFKIKPNICFRPKITIENVKKKRIAQIGERVLNHLIFHLGLIEIPSYWKATCSPEIEIQTGYLNKEQIKWWKDLIINGMGQFFYENKIDFRKPNFLKISAKNRNGKKSPVRGNLSLWQDRFLVPIGGGKDSIVTLEELKKQRKKIGCFLVNPNKIMKKVVKVAGIKDSVIVRREIDPVLLELNKKRFLNGHTPITAVFSFLSVLVAVFFNYSNIAFSNEKSADEGNVKYLGVTINHQWSKSSQFEKKFKYYCKKYLAKEINYFSYLRNYGELEISKKFIKYPQYFSVFSSCNNSMKIEAKEIRWCGNCPKCLFVYASLYPLLNKKQLFKIFGRDFFQNRKLLPTMKSLIGKGKIKPFECVGTYKESQLAFKLSLEKDLRQMKRKPIPYLLKIFNSLFVKASNYTG